MGIYEDIFGQSSSSGIPRTAREMARLQAQRQAFSSLTTLGSSSLGPYRSLANVETRNPEGTLALIKKSIKEIKAEAVNEDAQYKILEKIDRLENLGVKTQAIILETELMARIKLMRVQEWDYKVLPVKEIGKFENENRVTATRDGIKVHIDPLNIYCGAMSDTNAKDKIIPDFVLDELEKAQGRQIFDEYSVLWVERVKDPLLLGLIKGCKDYFLIAEWGEDVSFDQIIKNNE